MQYSPKLKKVIAEINQVLVKHDVAGMVVLHLPGNSEFLLKLDPSYSCAKFNGNELRVRAKLQQDFKGDKKAWTQKVTDTSNMLNMLTETGMVLTSHLAKISIILDKTVDARHTDSDFSSHTTQNT